MKTIGFTNKYYTLWDVLKEEQYLTINGQSRLSGITTSYLYLQNLSMSLQEAKAKFEKLTGEKAPEPDKELYGRNRTFTTYQEIDAYPSNVFNRGKYTGQSIEDYSDYGYLKWAYANMLDGDRKEIAAKVLESAGYRKSPNGEEMLTEKEYKVVVDFDKLEQQRETFIKNLKKLGSMQIDVAFDKNLDEYGRYYSKEYRLNIQFPFNKIRMMSYNGYPYALPLVNGIPKRIKGKKVKLTVEYSNDGGWENLKVKSIDKI